MPHVTLVLTIVVLVLLGLLLPRRRNFAKECEELVDSLTPNQMSSLAKFIQDPFPEVQANFWRESGALAGLWRRWRNMTILMRLCQLTYEEGSATTGQTWALVGQVNLFTLYTLLALPEALLATAWSGLPHICAYVAFQTYCGLSASAFNYCYQTSSPECVSKLGRVL